MQTCRAVRKQALRAKTNKRRSPWGDRVPFCFLQGLGPARVYKETAVSLAIPYGFPLKLTVVRSASWSGSGGGGGDDGKLAFFFSRRSFWLEITRKEDCLMALKSNQTLLEARSWRERETRSPSPLFAQSLRYLFIWTFDWKADQKVAAEKLSIAFDSSHQLAGTKVGVWDLLIRRGYDEQLRFSVGISKIYYPE